HGELLELVGADRTSRAVAGHQVETRLETGKRPRMIGDMRRVVANEIGEQTIEIARRDGYALLAQRAREHVPGAAADHGARLLIGDGTVAFAREHRVERGNEGGRGVDQRSVEV